MKIIEYLENYHILTSTQATIYPFLETDDLTHIENIMRLEQGERELFFKNDTDIETTVQKYVNVIFSASYYYWNKLYNSMNLTYSLLTPTSITETETITAGEQTDTSLNKSSTGSQTRTGNNSVVEDGSSTINDTVSITSEVDQTITITPTLTDTLSKPTYDSAGLQDVEKNAKGGNQVTDDSSDTTSTTTDVGSTTDDKTTTETISDSISNSGSGSETGSVDTTKTQSINRNRSGYENYSVPDSIQKEREVAKLNFLQLIATSVSNSIAFLNYDFK